MWRVNSRPPGRWTRFLAWASSQGPRIRLYCRPTPKVVGSEIRHCIDREGDLIDPDSVVGVMEQGFEVTGYGSLTVPEEIPSLGEFTISTHGRGELATGSVRCTAPSGVQKFTAVALELDTTNGIFTTLPVVPVSR